MVESALLAALILRGGAAAPGCLRVLVYGEELARPPGPRIDVRPATAADARRF